VNLFFSGGILGLTLQPEVIVKNTMPHPPLVFCAQFRTVFRLLKYIDSLVQMITSKIKVLGFEL